MSEQGYTYTATERQPAGAANKTWRFIRCNGDYIFATIYNGRSYSSANRGVDWSEEQPAGAVNLSNPICDINASGQMILAVDGRRLYSKLAGSWVEQQPAGAANMYWKCAAISPNGTRMLVAAENARIYSYYDGSWTEEQPIGDANSRFYSCDILDDGTMLLGQYAGYPRVKPAGGSWTTLQPIGATASTWRWCCLSSDGTKYLVGEDIDKVYRYDGGWSRVLCHSRVPANSAQGQTGDADGTLTKIAVTLYDYGGVCNAVSPTIAALDQSQWPTINSTTTADPSYVGISGDGTLIATAQYNGRLYTYERDARPLQTVNGFRKQFTVSRAAGTAENFKIRLRIYNKYASSAYLHCEGRANTDFSDLYFTDGAGNTLRHCIDDSDLRICDWATGFYYYVWVEVKEIGATPGIVYMYYGSTSHSDSRTALADFFDVYDDAERGVDNDAVGGAWTVAAGTVRIATEYAWRGTRSIEFVGGGTKGQATIPVVAGDETYIGFGVLKSTNAGMQVLHGDASSRAQFAWGVDETLKNYTGGAYEASLVSPGYTHWHIFEIFGFDWAADTYDLYVNGTKYGDGLSMQATASDGVLSIAQLGTSGFDWTNIDSLRVCYNCNPAQALDSVESEQGYAGAIGPAGVKSFNGVLSAAIKSRNTTAWSAIKALNN